MKFYECGICCYLHRWGFNGDCRDNSERFVNYSGDPLRGDGPYEVPPDAEILSMNDRVEADNQ